MSDQDAKPVESGAFRYAATIVLLFFSYVVIRYCTVLIHEVMGHGLAADMTGGSFFAVYATPTNGFASLYLPMKDASTYAFVLLAGIMVTMLLGLLALLFSRGLKGAWKVLALLFAEAALMSSSLYLAFGGMTSEGDPYAAMIALTHKTELANALAPVGIILSLLFAVFLSREFVRVDIVGDSRPLVRAIWMWYPGMVFGIVALSAFLMNFDNQYGGLYGATYLFAALGSSYVATIGFNREVVKASLVSAKKVVVVAVCFSLAMYAWVGVFDPNSSNAKGIMIKEPPLEVEASYASQFVGNAGLTFRADRTVHMELKLKPFNTDGSPLEKKIFATFENRSYLPYYRERAREFAYRMFNLSFNETQQLNISTSLGGQAEVPGQTYENARVCTLDMVLNITGDYNVTVRDPWYDPNSPESGFLDKLTVSWDPGMQIRSYSQTDGAQPVRAQDSLTWLNGNRTAAPTVVWLSFSP